jgi:hypothetical protein
MDRSGRKYTTLRARGSSEASKIFSHLHYRLQHWRSKCESLLRTRWANGYKIRFSLESPARTNATKKWSLYATDVMFDVETCE